MLPTCFSMGNLSFKWLSRRPQIFHSLQLRTPKPSIPFLPSPPLASRAGQILPCLGTTAPAITSGLRAASLARRYHRSVHVHPPVLLGFISAAGFQPAERPHPSAAAARAVAQAADFSFSFIPCPTSSHHCWHPCDVRDGRALVDRRRFTEDDDDVEERLSLDLAVCDPLSRRYQLLPPMTDDLLASVGLRNQDMFNSGTSFFIPSGDMEVEDETSFSAMCWMHSKTKLVVFFFSSSSDHWTVGTSTSWVDLGLHDEEVNSLDSCQYVCGCFYWKVNYTNKLLKLDMSTMEFSTCDLPPDHEDAGIVIVDSGEGKVSMFSQLVGAGRSVDYYDLLQDGTEKCHEWQMKSTIPLPAQYTSEFYISGPAEGYIFLAGTTKKQDAVHAAFFSLEIKSFKIERVSRKTFHFRYALPYFGFPPSMTQKDSRIWSDKNGGSFERISSNVSSTV